MRNRINIGGKKIKNRSDLSGRKVQKIFKGEIGDCMFLSICIGSDYLQLERNMDRAIDRTCQISI
jgi:hypothetical protein